LKGGFWDVVGGLNDHFNTLGFSIIGIFVAAWLVSFVIYRAKGLDRLEIQIADRT
jgi:high-affinity nickel-transport protein